MVNSYSTRRVADDILKGLLNDEDLHILPQVRRNGRNRVDLVGDGSRPSIPVVFKAGEAIAALKGLESAIALSLAQERFGDRAAAARAHVDVNKAVPFLFMSFMCTVDGYDKWDPKVFKKLRDLDVHQVYSNVYRRMVTNIYRTKDNSFYHLHTSLDAAPTLNLLDLPAFDDTIKDPKAAQQLIEFKTGQVTADELEARVRAANQAGSHVLTRDEFLRTPHGIAMSAEPIFSVQQLEAESPPVKLSSKGPYILSGVKILDLTRIIAGPVVSRTLAEYGADILHVQSLKLGDASFYQADFNFGKRTVDLDLKSPEGRAKFEELLDEVDVVVDGYRPGALSKLGYGPAEIAKRIAGRGRGFVYVSVNCYGWTGPWADRPGWQQIADSVTGMSWANGRSLGKEEPIAPPFPLADYGAGEMGAIAGLNALHLRSVKGGSYLTSVSLVKFNDWLMSLGPHDKSTWAELRSEHPQDEITHLSNFDAVGKAAIEKMRRDCPEMWDEANLHSADAHFGRVSTHAPVVKLPGYKPEGWLSTTRCAGHDKPEWTQV